MAVTKPEKAGRKTAPEVFRHGFREKCRRVCFPGGSRSKKRGRRQVQMTCRRLSARGKEKIFLFFRENPGRCRIFARPYSAVFRKCGGHVFSGAPFLLRFFCEVFCRLRFREKPFFSVHGFRKKGYCLSFDWAKSHSSMVGYPGSPRKPKARSHAW